MRINRIIASLMALLMTLSAFSGLCVPTYAETVEIDDAVWVGDGFYVTGDKNSYKLNISDPDTYVVNENSTNGGIKTKDGRYTLEITVDADTKSAQVLTITNTTEKVSFIITNLLTGKMKAFDADGKYTEDFTRMAFTCQKDKLLTMQKMLESDTHILFVQPYTGEVACYDKRSEQTLSSNPYDVYTCTNKSEPVRQQLVSQILLDYTDLTGNSKTMSSYESAALNGQINVKLIKGGIRVEYTMGREEANYLVPRMISKERYEKLIRDVLEANPDTPRLVKNRFAAFYIEKNPEAETLITLRDEIIKEYPITKKMPIYVLSTDIVTREIAELEEFVKTYCPDYTYDDLEYDHNLTEYDGQERAPANFKMSIEYSLDENGMTARLPANGIRYDATNYKLKTIKMLPYMGAGSNENTGYIFLPDGSGAITRFEDYVGKSVNVAGTLYGTDYAYHTVTGRLQETMRLPVFGIVDNNTYQQKTIITEMKEAQDAEGNPILIPFDRTEVKDIQDNKGFLAIIEEGDAMVSIMSTSGASTHKYYNVVTSFSPRQSDEYRLSDSISAASNAAIVVESKRKYVGSLTMRYIMLTDEGIAEEKKIENTYDPSWMGMAVAYRDYLYDNGVLSKLDNVKEDLPLYVETFGTLETTEKIASIPVTVDKALTSFEQIKTMYDELSEKGISNLNFKLQGYYNGGMYSTVPYKLKWQKAAGGEEGFRDLIAYSKDKDFGVYPDFDFEYLDDTENFDGFSAKKHSIKTIDNRYSSRVMYNAATQSYSTYGGLCISPSAFTYLFDGLDQRYSKYENNCISVSTLGYALNSDFDEEDPYNREDSKALTSETLAMISEKYENVMAEGGNAYTLKYIDHLLDVSLDSSRYALTSAAVPFMGVVIHGSVNFTGSPINMEGEMDYALLKAIEIGASLYFLLSYENTELLKEDVPLSQYYSVRYDIWKEDVIKIYERLNSAISDLQDQLIVDHQFLDGSRVPDADEAEADKAAADKLAKDNESGYVTKVTLEVSRRLKALFAAGEIGADCKLVDFENSHEISTVITVKSTGEDTVATDAQGNKIITCAGDGVILTVGADKNVRVTLTEDAMKRAEELIAQRDAINANKEGFDKYATTFGTIVKVVYENGTSFILNYNDYSVVVVSDDIQYTVPAYSFVTIKNGTVYNFNASEDVITFCAVGSADNAKTVASGANVSIK